MKRITKYLMLAAVLVAGCGDKSDKPPKRGPAEVSSRWFVLPRIDGGPTLQQLQMATSDQLAALAKRAGPIGGEKLMVTGRLEGDGETYVCILKGALQGRSIKVPLDAAVAAEGRATSAEEILRLAGNALRDMAEALEEMRDLYGKTPDWWRRSLSSPEPDMQVLAARLLGEHKVASSIKELGQLLGDPRFQVADAAAEALVKIGSPEAVPIMLASIKRGDLRSETRVIEALGQIGGSEAIAYLEMVAEGHEIPEVRRAASFALDSARKKK